ncbi:hypothetical protein HXS70_13020 [Akkermansia muciniphila]|uniref:hypothetical protein n=1 Tax=Akkermansia muciniphila TaxID=239935 RepID=UPI00160251A0|nr:hypothetical protein [Akkermansia muciniphila]QNB44719.1 hypothetical protein HXS70_13020 [Akkermansia muciniphila]
MCIMISAILPRKRTYAYGTTSGAPSSEAVPPSSCGQIRIRGKRRGLLFPCVFQSLFLPVPPFSFSPADGTCPLQCRKVTDTYPFRAPGMPRPGVFRNEAASSMEMTSTSGRGPFCS